MVSPGRRPRLGGEGRGSLSRAQRGRAVRQTPGHPLLRSRKERCCGARDPGQAQSREVEAENPEGRVLEAVGQLDVGPEQGLPHA